MREQTLIRALGMHDSHINSLHAEMKAMQKALDKEHLMNLTHVMMWDTLLGLLNEKSMITREQFDEALKDLHKKTQVAFEAEQKAKAEAAELAKGKVTVTSSEPVISVVH